MTTKTSASTETATAAYWFPDGAFGRSVSRSVNRFSKSVGGRMAGLVDRRVDQSFVRSVARSIDRHTSKSLVGNSGFKVLGSGEP